MPINLDFDPSDLSPDQLAVSLYENIRSAAHTREEAITQIATALDGWSRGAASETRFSMPLLKDVTVQQVIVTTNMRRGNGSTDPIRKVLQVWSMDGDLIAENDPLQNR